MENPKRFSREWNIKYGVIFLAFVLGGLLGWYFDKYLGRPSLTVITQVREPGDLISPLLYSDDLEPSPDLNGLEHILNGHINSMVQQNLADSVSVYFRDLKSARWVGLNENAIYEPSSMLKIMVMMVYYAQASQDPSILEKKFFYQAKSDSGQNYKPAQVLSTGYHTVDELINAMIMYSDNDAAAVLTAHKTKNYIDLFSILHLPYPKDDLVVDYMSPQSFSVLFRVLYNGTYLTHDLSQKALELLTTTTFSNGIMSGVPVGTTVAHKFGEHTEEDSNLSVIDRELHDCGIVYYPSHPYLLCVMTKGQEFAKLERVISSVSKDVYQYVDSMNKK